MISYKSRIIINCQTALKFIPGASKEKKEFFIKNYNYWHSRNSYGNIIQDNTAGIASSTGPSRFPCTLKSWKGLGTRLVMVIQKLHCNLPSCVSSYTEATFWDNCHMKLVHHAASVPKGWISVWKTHAVRSITCNVCTSN